MGASKRCVTPERERDPMGSRLRIVTMLRPFTTQPKPQHSDPVPVVQGLAVPETEGQREEKEAAAFARSSVVESLFREACAELRAAS